MERADKYHLLRNVMSCKEKIISNDYADFIANIFTLDDLIVAESVDFCARRVEGNIGIVNVRRDDIPSLLDEYYGYTSIPDLYGLMQINDISFDPENLASTGNIEVQSPPLSLSGSGIILGFIDTGIRYQLDVFRRDDGRTRILSIWDQTIQEGEPPEDFLYGTEYTRDVIDMALQSESPKDIVPSTDEIGHGTAVASVAAGSVLNQGLEFRGAAPQADIAVVKLKGAKQYLRDYYLIDDSAVAYQENDIMEAVRYLEQVAVTFNRPVVIVLGIGTNLGSHSGTSPLAEYLNDVALRRNRVIVVCGGNEGDKNHHYSGNMPDAVEIRVAGKTKGFCMEIWGKAPDFYAITIRSPGGETSTELDYKGGLQRDVRFVFEKSRILVRIVPVEYGSGDELFFLRFLDPTPGVWTIRITPMNEQLRADGAFHVWLPITEFLQEEVTFLTPDPYVTLTEPSNASQVITISAYDALSGSWFSESGRGYARNGNIKPDLAAPGVQVYTVLGERTGSCYAAAMTAGCVAQFMEWAVTNGNAFYPQSRIVKSNLIRGANRSADIVYPDRRWGYGEVNISGTFETLVKA